MKKSILIIFIFTCFLGAKAQQAKYVDAYNLGKFDKCIELSKKAENKNSKDLNAFLYEALAWVEISKIAETDLNYKPEYKRANDKIISTLLNLKKKDLTGKFIKENSFFYNKARLALFEKGDQYAKTGDFEKVKTYYEKILNSFNDKRDFFYIGRSYLLCGQTNYGIRYINTGLEEYYKLFTKGEKPDSTFLNHILAVTDILINENLQRHTYRLFTFINLIFPDDAKKVSDHHLQIIEKANQLSSFCCDDAKLNIREALKAYNQYGTDSRFLETIKNGITQASNNISEYEYADTITFQKLDSLYCFAMDSVPESKNTLITINNSLKFNILKYYPVSEKIGISLYKEFLKINEKYDKILTQYLVVKLIEENSTNYLNQGYAILLQRQQFGISLKLKTLYSSFETNLIRELNKFGSSDEELLKIKFWLLHFPDFKLLESNLLTYYIRNIRNKIDENDFSSAQKILGYATKFYPTEKNILELKKECVSKDYKLNYSGSYFTLDELNWTGNTGDCDPGTISQLAQTKTLQRLNFFRRMAGLPDKCIFDTTKNRYCQAAALCMFAQGYLDHHPNASWKCFSEDALKGASHSNLGLGSATSYSVDQQIEDGGDNNKEVGHRTWLLTTEKKCYAYGASQNTVAFWTLGCGESYSDTIINSYNTEFVAWPPPGPVPNNLVFDRWSFTSYNNNFSFENPKIKLTLNGKPIQFKIDYQTSTMLVFVPQKLNYYSPTEQIVKVSITFDMRKFEVYGTDKTEKKTINYDVIIYQEE